ncbi:F12A21.16 [Arabidopsis lyrata subsp. lyrata]|uniref:F12A21.16 n=1 Tax=Arabidopsis lyrata subsp. lyrata TaxID=81972 RepID=D7KVN0_ARALL|nr:F12A21.16 [Arabidopsis lyrata subsp. lyrata]
MTENEGNDKKIEGSNPKKKLNVVTFTGAAGLPGCDTVCVNLSAKEILDLADEIIHKSTRVHDAVALVSLDKLSYENVVLPLAELEARQLSLIQCCVFPKMLSPHDNVRKASAEAEQKIDAHILSCRKREDVYRIIKIYAAKGESIAPEAKCYLQCLVRDFEDNGLNLTAIKREEVERLTNEIDELSLRYIRNLNEDSSCLFFTEDELAGLPLEFLQSLEKTQNKEFKLTLGSRNVAAILELCKIAKTRKTVAMAYGKRCGDTNIPVLQRLVHSRHRLARVLGYSHFADYALDRRMSKTSMRVIRFLEDISSSLTDLAIREFSILKDLKRKEEGEIPFGVEDLLYYIKRVEELQFDLDFGDIRQYFPVSLVLSGIFKICQDLFGIKIEEVTEVDVWYHDVRAFAVFDSGSGKLLGYFYLDMFTREGKCNHSCVMALQNNALFSNGACQIPVALLIAQFAKDGSGESVPLGFSEVVNLFHEFGHVVQHICNRASFARFSGLRVDPDFREIPSQLLENWQDITKPLVDEVCKTLKRWRYSFSALKSLQEILYCLFDQIIYSDDDADLLQLIRSLHPKVMIGLPVVEGTNPASCFPRAVIGSEATCYSRLWSEVYAADIFASKFGDGHPNLYAGLQFRDKVLAPGGGKEPMELLTNFLGREPSTEAFIDSRTNFNKVRIYEIIIFFLKPKMSMSLNALTRLPLKNTGRFEEVGLVRQSLFSSRTACRETAVQQRRMVFVVEAKGKKGMAARQYQRTPPPMPKIEDDGNPRFVIFIRMANVYLWYPLSIIAGGTTAKIMVAAKDNLLGKYIYKDTIARNIAAVIYRVNYTSCFLFGLIPLFNMMRKRFKRQQLSSTVSCENGNMRAALSTSDVIELPTQDQLKTVFDKVKDYFGDAKESFGKLTSLNPGTDQKTEETPDEKANRILVSFTKMIYNRFTGPEAEQLSLGWLILMSQPSRYGLQKILSDGMKHVALSLSSTCLVWLAYDTHG